MPMNGWLLNAPIIFASQEKYLSEPYSEDPPDPEAARRLLEFGDDYRTFLDSQSDCASSLSTNPNTGSPLHRRRVRNPVCNMGTFFVAHLSKEDFEMEAPVLETNPLTFCFPERP